MLPRISTIVEIIFVLQTWEIPRMPTGSTIVEIIFVLQTYQAKEYAKLSTIVEIIFVLQTGIGGSTPKEIYNSRNYICLTDSIRMQRYTL